MKLAVDFNDALIKMGIERSMNMIKEAGFDAVSFNIKSCHLDDDYKKVAAEIKASMDKLGLVCVQTRAPHPLPYRDEIDFSDAVYCENLRAFEFTELLGAKYCVIHAATVTDGPMSAQFPIYNCACYEFFKEEAQRCGVQIGIGYVEASNIYSQEYINKLMGVLASPVYYPHVDIGRATMCGAEADVFMRKLNCHPVLGVDVHDYNVQTDQLLPFMGRTNWDRVVKALVDIDYRGDITLKISKMHEKVEKYSVDMLPNLYSMAVTVGRELIRRIEAERKVRG